MVTLFITIAAALLLVAVALAYFLSGEAPEETARQEAVLLAQQGRQLLLAATAFHNAKGVWPDSLQQLVEARVLDAVPAAANGSKAAWAMPTAGLPVFVLRGAVKEEACRVLNDLARQVDGIALKAYASLPTQCYGPQGDLRYVVADASADLSQALPPGHVLQSTPPVARVAYGWLRAPRKTVLAGDTPQAQPSQQEGVLAASTTQLMFPQSLLHEASEPAQPLVISNPGRQAVELTQLEVQDPQSFTAGLGECPTTLEPGQSCALQVVFHPAEAGMVSSVLLLRADQQPELRVALTGAGMPLAEETEGTGTSSPQPRTGKPALEASFLGVPTARQPVDLGVQKDAVGRAGNFEPVAFQVTNTGEVALSFEGVSVREGDRGFSATGVPPSAQRACAQVRQLLAGQSCELFVSYSVLNKAGRADAVLEVTFRDPSHNAVAVAVPVTVKAHDAWLTLTESQSGVELASGTRAGPGGWNFEPAGVGEGPTKTYVLRNRGVAPVTLRRVEVNPLVVRPDAEAGLACAAGMSLAPGEGCPITLTFAPTVADSPGEQSHFSILVQTAQDTVGQDPHGGAHPKALGWSVQAWVK